MSLPDLSLTVLNAEPFGQPIEYAHNGVYHVGFFQGADDGELRVAKRSMIEGFTPVPGELRAEYSYGKVQEIPWNQIGSLALLRSITPGTLETALFLGPAAMPLDRAWAWTALMEYTDGQKDRRIRGGYLTGVSWENHTLSFAKNKMANPNYGRDPSSAASRKEHRIITRHHREPYLFSGFTTVPFFIAGEHGPALPYVTLLSDRERLPLT